MRAAPSAEPGPATAPNPSSWRPPVVVGLALFVLLLGANLPAPLYRIYQERFGFSNTVLMLVFATYAAVLIPSLVVFGQLSDRIGRRRVIAGALVAAALGLALFAIAQGTAWLFAARAAQGLAVGSASAAAIAALVELDPDRDEHRAALGSVVGQAGGAATAPLLAGMLAEWAPWPLILCYTIGIALAVICALAVLRLPEPARPGQRWRPQIPSVPAGVRSWFVRASLTGTCVWVVGALFLSVVPSYASTLLDVDNLALLALPTATMLATACLAHALSLRWSTSPTQLQLVGLALLVAGIALLAIAWPLHSLTVLLLAAVVAGTSLGLGFGGSQTEINQLAPDDRRGEVTAAYVTVIYTGITAASLTVGWLGDTIGIPSAVAITAAAAGFIATAIACWHRIGSQHRQHQSAAPASSAASGSSTPTGRGARPAANSAGTMSAPSRPPRGRAGRPP